MNADLKEKVALVTGGANGIGRATCVAFAKHGARVAVSDIDEEGGEATVRLVEEAGGEAIFLPCDVAEIEQVKNLVEQTVRRFGALHCAFNNAGIEGRNAVAAECTEDNWDRVMAINLKGVWLCMKYEIPRILQAGGGSIVNCSSVAGLVGFRGLAAYSASKHGMLGLTKTAALEYSERGVRVNAICPGVIRTPMVDRVSGNDPEIERQFVALQPIGRLGEPEEIAETTVWLCSDRAAFITGVALPADGGFVAQ